MNLPKPTHAYIGRCPECSAIHGAIADTPSDKRWVAKMVADMIRDGLNVERVPFGQHAPIKLDGCGCLGSARDRIDSRPTLFGEDTHP